MQTAYHGYQGSKADAARHRQREHRLGEAMKLRREAQTIGENITDLTCTANRIGESDDWQGVRYGAISATLRQLHARWQALIARANAMEWPGA